MKHQRARLGNAPSHEPASPRRKHRRAMKARARRFILGEHRRLAAELGPARVVLQYSSAGSWPMLVVNYAGIGRRLVTRTVYPPELFTVTEAMLMDFQNRARWVNRIEAGCATPAETSLARESKGDAKHPTERLAQGITAAPVVWNDAFGF
jgi:hypothetical protein